MTKKVLRTKKKTVKKKKKQTTKKTVKKKPTIKKKSSCHPNQLIVLKRNAYKSGESGNPKGRPKGSRNYKTMIREIVEKEFKPQDIAKLLPKGARDQRFHLMKIAEEAGGKISYKEVMILSLIMKAIKGDTYAFNALADREEGRPAQTVHNTSQSYEDFLDELPEG